ncbi:MAG TPA: proton-conducting transporter membrane subunit [Pirellulales bacterium]|jgi:NADH-quinone oxidoreductase subunit M
MTPVFIPWAALAVLFPLAGAIWVRFMHDPEQARTHSLAVCGLSLFCCASAWFFLDSASGMEPEGGFLPHLSLFSVDALSAPLLSLGALLYLLVVLATLGIKLRRISFSSVLVSEAILLATFSSTQPWAIIALLAAGTVPPWVELYLQRKPLRVYTVHMALFIGLLFAGQTLLSTNPDPAERSTLGAALLMAAVLVRSGILPLHCWLTDSFEHASFGTALLFMTPMVGAYAALRLVFPVSPDWMLHGVTVLSLTTALYAAGMALVQKDARRFFCYLFLSHSSLVFVGLEMATPVGVTGALCAWLSVGLSMAGFGLTLRAIETRTGRLSLDKFHGLFAHTPRLGALFLITGLASIGFPGTIGFIGAELLVEGAMRASPFVGIALVVTAALNGLAVLHAYFRVFTGTHHVSSVDLQSRPPEVIAVLVLSALIIGGGLYPQPGVASRYTTATELVQQRADGLKPTSDEQSDQQIAETVGTDGTEASHH